MKNKGIYIIAEAGVNHNGSIDLAAQLVDIAVNAGADAIKFQTFKADKLACKTAPKAEYQSEITGNSESQYEMLKKLELDEKSHDLLIKRCRQKGIDFLSTPFDLDSLELLIKTFNLSHLKIPSGEITNGLLLLKAASSGRKVILSTGMSTLGEVERALGVLAYGYTMGDKIPGPDIIKNVYYSLEGQQLLKDKVTLLHCTTEYPTPYSDVNLRAMDTLRKSFGLSVGLSDHTPGISVSIAAAARGASIIEKHFTLDRYLPGPDHKASLEPNELKSMVQSIREVEAALGNSIKSPAPSESKNIDVVRKSLVAACDIEAGELFTEENLTIKRPGTGISPFLYWQWLGKVSDKSYRKDELIR